MSEHYPKLPTLVNCEQSSESVKLDLFVPANLHWFRGHFPEQPILPGVVQLDWAKHYAATYLSLCSSQVKQVEVLKFQVVIVPQTHITLSLEQKSDEKFLFNYTSSMGTHASGRVILYRD
ncbi:thioester dehydrase [Alteromonas sp. C1M14]|uniref:ApeI family dehydratase n=1 Tax=Alteromonas sp. C1M14 TaxID=2841567 RepID=UPI001C081574|nr:thioester dehydrase [Alteromonas sp. C1M14]MBU2979659.1 thioester dehydrase [Alteromonas sp. C1M14]